jgi:hypothetical protein
MKKGTYFRSQTSATIARTQLSDRALPTIVS